MFYLVSAFIIFILLVVLSFVWPPDSPWSPWWRTSDAKIREGFKLAKITRGDTVYDLGSGDGRVVILAAREFGARAVGIEIDPLRVFVSRILVRLNKASDKVEIVNGDFKNIDVSPATAVFVYLVPKALERLLPKLKRELGRGTRIISNKYKIPGEKEIVSNEEFGLYIYQL